MKLLPQIGLVFAGGGAGCVLRFLIGIGFQRVSASLPLATFIANFTACAILAVTVWQGQRSALSPETKLFLVVGFCGGLSTFSTFSYENWLLIRQSMFAAAALNIVLSTAAGIAVFLCIRHA